MQHRATDTATRHVWNPCRYASGAVRLVVEGSTRMSTRVEAFSATHDNESHWRRRAKMLRRDASAVDSNAALFLLRHALDFLKRLPG